MSTDKMDSVQLKRQVGLFSASSLIISLMIGSGIFVSPTAVLKYSGSFGLCLIMWAVTGFISLLGALAFAELGAVVPRSGGEYAFFTEAFGPLHKFWGPLPAFVFSFVSILLLQPCAAAIVTLTSAEYLVESILCVVCIEGDTLWLKRLIAIAELSIISYINMTSVKLYLKIQNFCAVMKIVACLVVIAGGIYEVSIGNYKNLQNGFNGTTASPGNIALAFFSGMWAYGGWSNLTTITEELKKPEKNILRAMLITVPFVTVFYLLMNISYMVAMVNEEMLSSQAVAITFGKKMLGSFLFIIPLGVTISTFGCALTSQFSTTRLCYVAGQYNHMPQLLCFIHVDKLTPCPAVLLQGGLAILITLMGDIVELIEFSGFLFWIACALCMVALIILRKTLPDVQRPWKVPIVIPVIVILLAVFLCTTSVITDLSPKYVVALGSILIAIAVYYLVVYKRNHLKYMDAITFTVQTVLQVVPTDAKQS